jgi:hypothetical protein
MLKTMRMMPRCVRFLDLGEYLRLVEAEAALAPTT